jgi:predicted peptidase
MPTQSHVTRRRLLAGAAAASVVPLASAHMDGRSQPQLLRRPYLPADGSLERNYFLYVPTGFYTEADREWPIMMFLHGNGERGNGREELEYTMVHGPLTEAWVQGRDLPFLIIQPQLPWYSRSPPGSPRTPAERVMDGPPPTRRAGRRMETPMVRAESGETPGWAERGTLDDGWDLVDKDLLTMLYETIADFRGDEDRVCCTGLSYGGFGTWYLGQSYPERFAAVAPVCGAGDPDNMQAIADAELPIWIHQGGRDSVVHAEHVVASARALEAAGHPEVRVTVHEDLGHNVWTRVYEGEDLYSWFLRQRRSR